MFRSNCHGVEILSHLIRVSPILPESVSWPNRESHSRACRYAVRVDSPRIYVGCFIVQASALGNAITLENWGETPVPEVICWMFGGWMASIVLLAYLEQVLVVGYGVRRKPWFCLTPSFWRAKLRCCTKTSTMDSGAEPRNK